MYFFAIAFTVASTVLYHLFQKITPANANPLLAFFVTYTAAALICLLLLPVFPLTSSLRESLKQLNWVTPALAVAIVGIELGVLLAYRAGWKISLNAIVANVAVTLILVPIGVLFFKEKISLVNQIGIAVCIAGLVMANWK
jgi:uncharacterized membrane protein